VAAPAGPILTVNAGSSSLKLRLLDAEDEVLAERESGAVGDEENLGEELAAVLAEGPDPAVAGHRIVHGGIEFTESTLVDPGIEEELERLSDLAPLHNPPAVAAMRALEQVRPGLRSVVCFDTAFHTTLSAAAATYALPAAWRERWPLRRFGFHGLSHAYVSRRAAELLGRPLEKLRIITAHLGAGASLCAVEGGASVDTTMGFTPLEGLVMATRSGSVDPGLLLWVQRHGDFSAGEMERILDRESGLLALSGRSGDMRELLAGAERGDECCQLAFDTYLHRLVAGIAAMAAAMGGADALVFTAGVGEHATRVRREACDRLNFLGFEVDLAADLASDGDRIISPAKNPQAVLVVIAREDLQIATEVRGTIA
jgi:acetate kinase